MKSISSRDNALLKRLRKLLTSTPARREMRATVLDGPHLIAAYLERFGSADVDLVMARSRADHTEIAALVAGIDPSRVSVADDDLLRSVSPVEHPVGVVACVPIPAPVGETPSSDALLLDGIQDPGNVGALLRTACAAGFGVVHLSPDCADAWSPKCLRGGMGAQFHLRIEEGADLEAVLRTFPGDSLACDAGAPVSLYALELKAPLALVLGSEGAGLRAALREGATHRCRIPMMTGVESLNVGAAGAVVMYEWLRRRTLT